MVAGFLRGTSVPWMECQRLHFMRLYFPGFAVHKLQNKPGQVPKEKARWRFVLTTMDDGIDISGYIEEEVTQNLPHDIIIDILSRLPVKSLLRCRCVCKLWCSLINSDDFIDRHLDISKKNPRFIIHSPLDENMEPLNLFFMDEGEIKDKSTKKIVIDRTDINRLRVWDSCNGLVCLEGSSREGRGTHSYYIYNPATQESVTLPAATPASWPPAIGFAFDASTKQYKVVRIYRRTDGNPFSSLGCEIYTLGSYLWRAACNAPYVLIGSRPVFVGGVLHWLTGAFPQFILSFHVSNEEFETIPIPRDCSCSFNSPCPVEFRGHLSLFCMAETNMDIWILKDHIDRVWVKEYSVCMPISIELFPFNLCSIAVKNNEILIMTRDGSGSKLVSYDLEVQSSREVDTAVLAVAGSGKSGNQLASNNLGSNSLADGSTVFGLPDALHVCPFVESLVSCKASMSGLFKDQGSTSTEATAAANILSAILLENLKRFLLSSS